MGLQRAGHDQVTFTFTLFSTGRNVMVNFMCQAGGGINWETGIEKYALLYRKYVTNKDLLYSTETSSQYSVMIYMGKECKKEQIYICV